MLDRILGSLRASYGRLFPWTGYYLMMFLPPVVLNSVNTLTYIPTIRLVDT
jgi:hypothetical protein